MQRHLRVGKYELVERIGQGGMAEVWRARFFGDNGFVKYVAVKKTLPEFSNSAEVVSMFLDEAMALVRLHHQNIVQVFELFENGSSHYIAMELIDGVDLRRVWQKACKGVAMPLGLCCFIISQVLKALDYAHSSSIVHRDISPQNILISFNGEVKVADFGIAKGEHRSSETVLGGIRGKYAYMSPEQAAGHLLDARSDLFSVGVVFFELITGHRFYGERNNEETVKLFDGSLLSHELDGCVPREVRPIVRKALKCDPRDRYKSAGAFLNDLIAAQKIYGFMAHEHDLAKVVRTKFPDEFKDTRSRYVSSGKAFIGLKNRTVGLKYGRRLAFNVVLISALLAAVTVIGKDSPPQKILQSVVEALASIDPPPINKKDAPKQGPTDKVLSVEQPKARSIAHLNVSAKPWGYVFLDDDAAKRLETPIRGQPIKAGRHKLRVLFEPEGKNLVRYFEAANSSVWSCFADFTKDANITCNATK